MSLASRSHRLLFTPHEITTAVAALMKPGCRRVAMTAFVGDGADQYIPDPQGVTIVCWPKAGGTNPTALRDLRARKARILVADKLHMKLYWAEGRGAIVGSANLTTNALGSGGLKELAVHLPSSSVDIDMLLGSVGAREIEDSDLVALDRAHQKIGFRFAPHRKGVTFLEWYDRRPQTKWKFGWWLSTTDTPSRATREKAKLEYNREPYAWIQCQENQYSPGDWILTYGKGKRSLKSPAWQFTDFVIQWSTSKSNDSQWDAVQVRSDRNSPPVPFKLDKAFQAACEWACRQYGRDRLFESKSMVPPAKVLALIADRLRRVAR